jgi:hypothetical protein
MRRTTREKGRKAALATFAARLARTGNKPSPPIDENHFRAAEEVFAFKYRDQLQEHMAELRSYGLDPNLIGEHEADPVMCSHCGEPIPWKVILGYRN